MYTLKIISAAQRDLDDLPAKVFTKAKAAILLLGQNPRPQGAIKLTQQEGYHIRIGDYRILYRIDDSAQEIYIYRIKHRREAYR